MKRSGAITKLPPPSRVIAAWKDACVRATGRGRGAPALSLRARGAPAGRGAGAREFHDLARAGRPQRLEAVHLPQAGRHRASIPESASTSASTWASSRISGGRSRTTAGSLETPARMPRSRRASRTSRAGREQTRPIRNPRPCTACTGPTRASFRIRSESRRTRGSRSSLRITRITVPIRGGGERPAAEGGAERAHGKTAGDLLAGEHRSRGEPGGERLAGGEEIGAHPRPLAGEGFSAAAHAALDLVEDQQRARGIRGFARGPQEPVRERDRSRHPQDRLHDEGGDPGVHRGGERRRVVPRDGPYPEGGLGKVVPLRRAVGHGGGGGGASVEPAAQGDHGVPPRPGAEGEAQGVFVRFGAAVHEKGPVEALGSETDERGGGGAAVRARNRVGLEEEPGGGGPERFQHRRVPVAEPADGVAAVEIEQRPPVGGAERDPVAGCDLDRQLGVNGKEMR